MSIENRAKQFMPFAALKGLPEALAEKEKVVVPKIELSPESEEELNYKMHQVELGDIIDVIYFNNNEYLKITGKVARIDEGCKILQIVNTKIPFDSILDISWN